ncbi:NAD(P)H-dependent amine dehydrogenase family protein [Nocardia alni]|uniref:NAD(P)H-dependent amine dehydrogenase family protein n=1 Tax=Nocardia alni TaxID=2815723 RepID=UPI001C238D9E|nr:dihydrodipicolinate reductase [Nocardia alni]
MSENVLPHSTSADATPQSPLRVVQWSTGTIGSRALRGILEHPSLELCGLYAHSAEKIGRDAGELSGLPACEVKATNDIDAIVDLNADCVLYMPLAFDADVVTRLLSSGTNVVTTCGVFHHPASMDPALREQITRACELGGTSIHATGSSPGFITEAVPLVLASIQRRLEGLAIDEYADLSRRDSPEMLFDIMGFGHPPADFDARRAEFLAGSFGPSLRLVAEALGYTVEEIRAHGEVATTRDKLQIAAGTLAPGTVAAQRTTIEAIVDGQPLLRFRANWYCTTDVEPAWDLLDTGWHISVLGDAPLEVTLRMPFPLERMAEISPAYTANRAVNAVAAVCAAAPGIHTSLDLPHLITHLT